MREALKHTVFVPMIFFILAGIALPQDKPVTDERVYDLRGDWIYVATNYAGGGTAKITQNGRSVRIMLTWPPSKTPTTQIDAVINGNILTGTWFKIKEPGKKHRFEAFINTEWRTFIRVQNSSGGQNINDIEIRRSGNLAQAKVSEIRGEEKEEEEEYKNCDKSVETVKRDVINGEFSDRLVLVLSPGVPLSEGSSIAENNFSRSEKIKVSRKSCFFFVDLVPTGMYGHMVLYILTDQDSGKITHKEWAAMPPLITDPESNGGRATALYETIEDRLSSTDRVFPENEADFKRPIVDAPLIPRIRSGLAQQLTRIYRGLAYSRFVPFRVNYIQSSSTQPCKVTKKVALLINGGPDNAYAKNVSFMSNVFKGLGFNEIVLLNWKDHSLQRVRNSIADFSRNLGRCDVLVIYVSAHISGYDEGRVEVNDGMSYKTDGEIQYNHGFFFRGQGFGFNPWSISNVEWNFTRAAKSTPDTGPGLLYSLRSVKAGFVQIILEMCNSGLLIDAAVGVAPEWSGPPIGNFLTKDQTLSILAASNRFLTTKYYPAGDFRRLMGKEPGGYFTQTLANYFQSIQEKKRIDTNFDGVIDKEEYRNASKQVMSWTRALFNSDAAKKEGAVQDPPPYFELNGIRDE